MFLNFLKYMFFLFRMCKWGLIFSPTNSTPTFSDFVNSIRKSPALQKNPHIRPMLDFCHFCSLNYDFVMKVETLEEDFKLLQGVKKFEYVKELIVKHQTPGLKNATYKFIKQLNKEQVRWLCSFYERDFLAFEYDLSPYLAIFE